MIDDGKIAESLHQFADDRDWHKFHTPKNLAISLSIESGELLELFQWTRGQDDWGAFADAAFKSKVEDEVADILIYAIRFSALGQIDLQRAIERKLSKNADKYPADAFRSSDKKYNES